MIPFSQPQRIDLKRFRAIFRTLTTLQPPPPTYVVASNTFPFENLFHGSYFPECFFPSSATLLATNVML